MLHLEQITAHGIEAPEPGVSRHVVILIELRVKVRGAVARSVAGENDAAISSIARHHIVKVRRLIGYFRDNRDSGGIEEVRNFVKLPKELRLVIGAGRRSDD